MFLYELPRDVGEKIKVKATDGTDIVLIFHHIDGMYSYCTDKDGAVYHLSASTPLIKVGEYYEIAE